MQVSRARGWGALLLTTALVTGVAGQALGAAKKPTKAAVAAVAFANYPLPNSSAARGSGEPSIGINWNSGNVLFQAGARTYRATFDTAVRPPAVIWKDVSSPYTPINLDPILATDPTSGRTLAGGDAGSCGSLALTLNDGDSWAPSVPCTGIIDHPTVGFGPLRPETASLTGDRVGYYCQQYPIANECSRSLDGGANWSPAVPIQYCVGLFGHVKTSRDGIAYLPSGGCYANGTFGGSTGVGGAVSLDNGLTWRSYTIPGAGPGTGFDPSVGVASDGTVYESWTDESFHLRLSRSGDHALSWSAPIDLSKTYSPTIAAATFPSVVAGDRDRVAVAYLGSTIPVTSGDPFSDGYHGIWHLYVSLSYNGGNTWTTQRISTDPVQRSYIDNGGVAAGDHRNLLDFMDAGLTKTGRVVIGYADGCIATCADSDGTEASSISQYGTVALQWQGKGLFAQYDSVNK